MYLSGNELPRQYPGFADGMCDFVNSLCEKPFKCAQVSLSSADNALFLVITMPKDYDSSAMVSLRQNCGDTFEKTGLSVRVSWVELAKTSFVDNEALASLAKNLSSGRLPSPFLPSCSRRAWPRFYGVFSGAHFTREFFSSSRRWALNLCES